MHGTGFGGTGELEIFTVDEPEDDGPPPAAEADEDELSYEPLPSLSGFELGGV